MTIETDTSAALEFLKAARIMQTAINGALSSVLDECRQQGFYGLSKADPGTLHAILENDGTTSAPLEISKNSGFNKGAFSRTLPSLAKFDYVQLEKEGSTITSVTLTDQGREVAECAQKALNEIVPTLKETPAVQKFAKLALGQS